MTTIERKPEGQRLERLISDCFSGGEICRRELRLQEGEAQALEQAIGAKLRWFADEGGLSQLALGLRGEENPSYSRVRELAQGLARGLEPLRRAGFASVVVVERDMAKVLGQTMAPLLEGPVLCLDGVGVDNGDYIDIGAPVANGAVLPVIIKTLVFNK